MPRYENTALMAGGVFAAQEVNWARAYARMPASDAERALVSLNSRDRWAA